MRLHKRLKRQSEPVSDRVQRLIAEYDEEHVVQERKRIGDDLHCNQRRTRGPGSAGFWATSAIARCCFGIGRPLLEESKITVCVAR